MSSSNWGDILGPILGVLCGALVGTCLVVGLGLVNLIEKRKVAFAIETVEAVLRSPKLADLPPDAFKVIRDLDHDCEYVLIGNTVWAWRGTNLLGVSNR